MNTDKLKGRLEDEKKLLISQLRDLGWKDPASGKWEATPGDLDVMSPLADANEAADKMEEYEEHEEELAPLEARYKEVAEALERMSEGTYGTCSKCGEKIEDERLDANPAAATCITHA